jgi:alpha-ketoglutarate-dependent 2,4-dichlorophenoxyacetate dioxygenase
MPLSIRPIRSQHPDFAGDVSGVDIRKPLSREDAAAIDAGMDRYAVLVLHGQRLTDEQQITFSLNFGDLESYKTAAYVQRAGGPRLGKGMADLSNLNKDGTVLSADDRAWFFKLGDRLWHSDSSFRPAPAKYSLLSARAIPSWGGNTEFADMRAAYDALDVPTKAEIEDLVCEHSLIYSRQAIGFTDLTAEEIEAFKPVRQPLVRRHPVTGRTSLFLSSHAGSIIGWTVPEARMLLRDLIEHATQPQFVYSHAWTTDDLVMWDNRQTMHRGRRFDRNEVRDVRRTTLAGHALVAEPD